MKQIQITINSLNLDYVKEKIEKFNHKAVKVSKSQLEVNYSASYINETDTEDIKELIDITINQLEELIIADYKLIAKIDHTYPVKNFVKPFGTITTEQENEYQLADSKCEHCNSNRKRNMTFILQHIETERYIQVGKTCLVDFLGHDIEKKLNYFDLLEELQFDIVDFDKKSKKQTFLKIIDILGMTQTEIKENGYKSSKYKYDNRMYGTTSTGDDIKSKINDIYSHIDDSKRHLPKASEEQIIEIENVVEYMLNCNTENEREGLQDFYNNLKNILKYDYCKFNDIAILATLFVVTDILKANEIKEEEKKESNYVGNVGDKIEVNLTLEAKFGYDTEYGYMHISLFKDTLGNIYKWSSKSTLAIEKGEYKTVKATIKAQEEYNGQKQNVILRCKIV